MAVEYEISSDVATIKDVAPNTQVARVVSLYSGQITYDEEAGSKFATATIDGKSQRVMLCIAVNGTVNYDDVPCLYSTVDGHRCLNIVAPTETGTPDDVPSVYETVVIDGMNVRAVRCIMINKTPVYDGVSSTCTFTGDDGKTHTAQLVNKITGGSVDIIVKGVAPLSLPDAIADSLSYVKAFGGTEQRDIPDNYLQRQFIYMMDGSYLLTDIVPTYDCKIEMDFQTTSVPASSVYLLGGRTVTYGGLFFAKGGDGTVLVDAFGTASGDRYTSNVSLSSNTRYKFTFDNKVATLVSGGTTLFTNTSTGENANGAALCINGLNSSGTVSGAQAGIYLYSFKVWNAQGELIADYVPAIQKGTVPVVGFYDTVSKTFKTATAGTFAAGGEAVPTPDTPMDVVSNNGVLKFTANEANYIADNVVLGYWLRNSDGQPESSTANFYTAMMPVKPNTSYVCFGRNKETDAISGYNRIAWYDANGVWIRNSTYTANLPGIDIAPSNVAFARFHCNINGTNVTQELVDSYNWVFQQGTAEVPYTPYSPTGVYTDGTVETIKAHGKNLFNVSANPLEQGGIASNDGQDTASSYYQRVRTNGYIPVKPSTTYTASVKDLQIYYLEYAQDTTYTNRHASGFADNSVTFTTGANTYFVRLQFRKSGNADIAPSEVTNVQLEPGSTATEYQPYYDGGTATAEMLLKVGDYQDVQSIIDGAITRNVGVKVLDGTENWQNISNYINISKEDLGSNSTVMPSNTTNIICSHFETKTGAFVDGIGIGGSYVNFKYDSLFTTVAQFKQLLADQYAAGTPVTVLYPLATPTTESVAGQTLQVTDGDNVLEITQASLNNLELECKYKKTV